MYEMLQQEGVTSAAAVTFFAIFILSLLLPLIVCLLLPGRKGTMRTERQVAHAGLSQEEAWKLYADRFAYEGFRIDESVPPHLLRARRPAKSGVGTIAGVHAIANKDLAGEATFHPAADGVAVTVTLWTPDYVIYDTGEGAYIDQMMERLLHADLATPPPVVASPSFSPIKALTIAALIWVGALVVLYPDLSPPRVLGIFVGLVASTAFGFVSVFHGLWEISRRPEELTGRGLALLAALLLLGGLALASIFTWARLDAPPPADAGPDAAALVAFR